MSEKGMDLGQSDVYTGYTYQYIWSANQLSHFAIGFLVNWLFLEFLRFCEFKLFYCRIFVTIILIGLYILKESGDIRRLYSYRGNVIPINKWKNFHDTLTDIAFVALGAYSSYMALFRLDLNCVYYFLLILFGFGLFLLSKQPLLYNKRFDHSGVLVKVNLYNLCYECKDLNRKPSDELFDVLKNFVQRKKGIDRIYLSGEDRSGKTTLAWGIATHLCIDGTQVAYISLKNDYSFLPATDFAKAGMLILDDLDKKHDLTHKDVKTIREKCPENIPIMLIYSKPNDLPKNVENTMLIQKKICDYPDPGLKI